MSKNRGWLVLEKTLRQAGLREDPDYHAAWLRRSGADVIRYGKGRAWAVDTEDPRAQAWLELITAQGRDLAVAQVHDAGAG